MGKVTRFGVSLPQETLNALDDYSKKRGYQNRSQALTLMIEDALVNQTALDDSKDVAGALVLIFDHHRSDFMRDFTAVQHDYQTVILASQHIHIDHHNCLETITMRGRPSLLNELADKILSIKGIKHGKLVFTVLE
jgi:CopG family nickel-responsive transcriptional regulator